MRLKDFIYVNAYKAGNLGDDLFLKTLFERYPNGRFLLYDGGSYREIFREYKNARFVHPISWRIYNVISQKLHFRTYTLENMLASGCKAAIEIGGSLYIEPRRPALRNDLFGRKPFYILGVNFGPYHSEDYLKLCRIYFEQKTDVCFRDKASFSLFRGLPAVRYAPDILFTQKLPCEKGNGLFISAMKFSRCHPKLAKYQENYDDVAAALIRERINGGGRVILGAFCEAEGDAEELDCLIQRLPETERGKVYRYIYKGNMKEMLFLINSCDTIFATRFHSIVLGLLMQKNVIPVCYSGKAEHLLADMGLAAFGNLPGKLTRGGLKSCRLTADAIERQRIGAQEQFAGLDKFLRGFSRQENE